MRRLKRLFQWAAPIVVAAVFLSGCGFGGPSREEQLKATLDDAATSVPGVVSSTATAKVNTSGNFLGAVVVADTQDPAELKEILRTVITAMLERTADLESGTLSVSVFSPDKTQSVSVDDLGYTGLENLRPLREYFAS
ncbi:hypothetical protein [Arthrobacter sp. ISL-72]|uniref:hypothetical protein n=1 Tax=Arthrobacter sp. ISL-72 TaxID=2819114 RepID=UPI001BEC3B48|nr:hypothetical protein [Arthrobacter sp. ISL-72]MBT2596047.1 hypothetical protein [Arthrobacter sp. ISL-72]